MEEDGKERERERVSDMKEGAREDKGVSVVGVKEGSSSVHIVSVGTAAAPPRFTIDFPRFFTPSLVWLSSLVREEELAHRGVCSWPNVTRDVQDGSASPSSAQKRKKDKER